MRKKITLPNDGGVSDRRRYGNIKVIKVVAASFGSRPKLKVRLTGRHPWQKRIVTRRQTYLPFLDLHHLISPRRRDDDAERADEYARIDTSVL